ncbi:hypothetical protein SDC49_20000 [Lactobacillus sp. R2/2]|nr:hypothetical protein [Lactobacillus sp. R2/2]MEB3364988.1 hypothetical protein [Lactobacillus sp. R2/2]
MDPNKMTLPEIIANFRARNVTFKLKDGSKKTIFVEEIENEDDDQPELIFMLEVIIFKTYGFQM